MAGKYSCFTTASEIMDHLYLSGFICAEESKLKEIGITAVVDATNVSNSPIKSVDYLKIPVEDSEGSNIKVYFDEVADKILQVKLKNGKILVHCAAGISRSTSLVLAYMVKHENMTLKEAYQFVHDKRPIISPNIGFWKQLIDYERSLRNGSTSVTMIRTRYREMPDVYLNGIRSSTTIGSFDHGLLK